MALSVGQLLIGKYKISRLIGQGGMGAVYEGENIAIQRRVAIKVLYGKAADSADAITRFEREARAAGRIGNDHIVEVLDLGKLDDGDHFMVLEYLDGETLGERIRNRGRMAPRDLAPLARQMLAGLGAAHRAGIIHRDLKPDNIFLLRMKAGHRDFVKIIDFGISKFTAASPDELQMTAVGQVMGTPYYMSPEQARGAGQVDFRSDLYSVGVIVYEAVTGRVPFEGATFNDLIVKIVLADYAPARKVVPALEPAFDSIIARAMAKDPAARFQSAEEFARALHSWETNGAAVAAPRSMGPASAPLPGPSVNPNAATLAAPSGTAQSWSQSNGFLASQAAPKRSSTLLLFALVAAALAALGGTAFLVIRSSSRTDVPAPAAASAEVIAPPPVAPLAPPAPPPATPAAVAPQASVSAAPPPAPVNAAVPQAPAARSPAPPRPEVPFIIDSLPPSPVPAAAPPPVPEPVAPAPPAPVPPVAPAREERDFGY